MTRRKTRAQTVVADYRKTIVRQARETIAQLTGLLRSADRCLDQHGTFPIFMIDVIDLVRDFDRLQAKHIVLDSVEVDIQRRARKKS